MIPEHNILVHEEMGERPLFEPEIVVKHEAPDPGEVHAADISVGVLQSAEFQRAWADFYRSRKTDANPIYDAVQRATRFKNGQIPDPKEQRDIAAFLREVVGMQIKALGPASKKDDQEIMDFRSQLDQVGGVLYGLTPPGYNPISRAEIQNTDFQDMLKVMERHFMQRNIDPIRTTKEFFSEAVSFVWDSAKANPKKAAAAFSAYSALVAFMTVRLPRTDLVDEVSAGIRDFDLDENGNVVGVQWEQASLEDLDSIQLPSHGELQSLFPEFSDQIRDSEFLSSMVPHVSKVKDLDARSNNLVHDSFLWANNLANDTTEKIREYTYDIGVTDVVSSPTNIEALQNTAWMRGYEFASHYASEFWYSYNMLENVALHPAFAALGFTAVVGGAALSRDRIKQGYNSISDFFNRSVKTRPITTSFSVAAMGLTLAAHNFDPNVAILWAGIGGALLGHYTQKTYRHALDKNKKSAMEMIRGVKTSLKDFNKVASPTALSARPSLEKNSKVWRNFLYASSGAAAFSATVLGLEVGGVIQSVPYDSVRALSEMVSAVGGALSGIGTTTLAFVHYNVPDEIIQHRGWTTLGAVFGVAALPSVLSYRAIKNRLKNKAVVQQHTEPGL